MAMLVRFRRLSINCWALLAFLASIWLISASAGELPLRYAAEVYPSRTHGGHWQSWSVVASDRGPLLVGNGNRLLVFDGAEWRSVSSPNNTRIRDLIVEDDRLWIGAEGDFGFYSADDDGQWTFRSLRPADPQVEGAYADIWNVRKTEQAIWFNARTHLFRWSQDEGIQILYPDQAFLGIEVLGGRLLALQSGVGLVDPLIDANIAVGGSEVLAGATLARSIKTETRGTLILTRENGLWAWHEDQLVQVLPYEHPALVDVVAFDLLEWPDGRLILSHTDGLSVVSSRDELLSSINQDNGLPTNIVFSMGMDRDHGLWLAQPGFLTRLLIDLPLRYVDALPGKTVNYNGAIYLDSAWWLATDQGVWRQNSNGEFSPVEGPRMMTWTPLPFENGVLIPTTGGVYWIADRTRPVATEQGFVLDIPYAYELLASRWFPGRVYVSTDRGLQVLEFRQGRWTDIGIVEGVGGRPSQMLEAEEGELWIGTPVQSLFRVRFDSIDSPLAEAKVERFGAEHGLPPGNVLPFFLDGKVRIGTTEGLWQIVAPPAGSGPVRFEADPDYGGPFQSADVFRLLELGPDEVFLRVGNQTGRAIRSNGEWQWQNAFYNSIGPDRTSFFALAPDGQVLSNIGDDLVLLDPADWQPPTDAPPLILSTIQSDGQILNSPLSWLQARADLKFEQSPNVVRVHFALPTMMGGGQTRYRSRLLGLSDRWSDWTHESWREFTQLSGGDYRLEVQARDRFGRQSESQLLRLQVPSPWYLGPWAWTLYAAVALIALSLAALLGQRWRSRQLLERKAELEAQVEEKTRQLRDEAEAREQFFANMSHEFRTPLTLILAPLDTLLEESSANDARQRSLMETIKGNALRMKSLIDELLDFNRFRSSPDALKLRPMDLAYLLRKRCQLLAPAAEAGSIRLCIDIPEDPVLAMIDLPQFEKVLFNVLGNALKFTPEGGSIQVQLASHSDRIQLDVSDSGPGLSSDDHDSIFELYYTGDRSSEQQAGTGIGLALSRTLIEQHGGRISARPNSPEGLTLQITLPVPTPAELKEPIVLDDETVQPRSLASAEPGTAEIEGQDDLARPGLLIIDDNADLRRYLALTLGRNYRIALAEDGRAGLARARSALPDVVICDWMMPGMDGIELLTQLRADPELGGLAVMILTARCSRADAIEALSSGADDFMTKPFDTAELIARIEALRATRRRARATLAKEPPSGSASSRAAGFEAKLLAAIQAGYTDSTFNVAVLAEQLHMDRTTLYRKCQQAFEASPGDLLLRFRLDKARELLLSKRFLVGDTAYAVGFESRSYFSRAYRKHFGNSPGADVSAASH